MNICPLQEIRLSRTLPVLSQFFVYECEIISFDIIYIIFLNMIGTLPHAAHLQDKHDRSTQSPRQLNCVSFSFGNFSSRGSQTNS
jgi:hypothetical protein